MARITNKKISTPIPPPIEWQYMKQHIKTYTIELIAKIGGKFDPPKPEPVKHGGDLQITIIEENGYMLSELIINDKPIPDSPIPNPYTLRNITTDCIVTAIFEEKSYTIKSSAGYGGKIEHDIMTVPRNENAEIVIKCEPGYILSQLIQDNQKIALEKVKQNKYVINKVISDHLLEAIFQVKTHRVTVTMDNGKIYPSRPTIVIHDGNQVFRCEPSKGKISTVTVLSGDADKPEIFNGTSFVVNNIRTDIQLKIK